MAERIMENETARFSVSYQAVCTNGDFNGPRRATENEAFHDARRHRAKPGNEDHIIDIVVSQSIRMRFSEEMS